MTKKVVIYKNKTGFNTFIFTGKECYDLLFTDFSVASAVAKDYCKQLALNEFCVYEDCNRVVFKII